MQITIGKKTLTISSILAILLIVSSVLLLRGSTDSSTTPRAQSNVSIVDGTQIIEINARGGYSPWLTQAKANMPTNFKIVTRGTFDCSSALVIPAINYRGHLPPSGETLIELPPQPQGSIVRGLCAMGMYNFSIKFN